MLPLFVNSQRWLVSFHLNKTLVWLLPLFTSNPACSLEVLAALLFNCIILSWNAIVSVLTVVVVPCTVKFPPTIKPPVNVALCAELFPIVKWLPKFALSAANTVVEETTSASAVIPESFVLSALLITTPLPKSVTPLILATVTALFANLAVVIWESAIWAVSIEPSV